MNIELHAEVLRIKSTLNKINDTSFACAQLSKIHPLGNATTDAELNQLKKAYEQLIVDLINYLQTTKYGRARLDQATQEDIE